MLPIDVQVTGGLPEVVDSLYGPPHVLQEDGGCCALESQTGLKGVRS